MGQRGVERLQLGFTMPFVGALFTIVLQLHNETTSSFVKWSRFRNLDCAAP